MRLDIRNIELGRQNNPMNKAFFSRAYRHLPAIALMAMTLLGTVAPPVVAQKKTKRPTYVVQAGTVMRLRLNQALSSKTALVADAFTSTVVDPVYVRGVEVIPAGSTVSGKITQATKATRKSRAGSLNVTFTSIRTPRPKLPSPQSGRPGPTTTPSTVPWRVMTAGERSRANQQKSGMLLSWVEV